ncbi:MAG: hypothetical protein LBS54_01435 [Dysgonamonadaceae bacterium]|jgi:hypothetical protein|nr:hypothetical protein [Dysgonamonadaceae bacterium]
MERRQSVKKDGTESKTPRYVVITQAGYFKPLNTLKNAQNEIVMYYQRNDKCNPNSTAETRLQCKGSINFSSVYLENLKIGETLIGYGEPPQTKELGGKKKQQNPFFDNRADGYLFVVSPDLKTIEILVVPQGRLLIRGHAAKLADGQLNEALNELRKSAKWE